MLQHALKLPALTGSSGLESVDLPLALYLGTRGPAPQGERGDGLGVHGRAGAELPEKSYLMRPIHRFFSLSLMMSP